MIVQNAKKTGQKIEQDRRVRRWRSAQNKLVKALDREVSLEEVRALVTSVSESATADQQLKDFLAMFFGLGRKRCSPAERIQKKFKFSEKELNAYVDEVDASLERAARPTN